MRLRTTRRDERGQGSLESVGVVILAAILVMATTGVIIQSSPSIRGEVGYRICQVVNVVGGGDCAPPDPVRTQEDRVPDEPCVVGSELGDVEVTGSFGVSVTAGKSFLVEELSDGTYKITEVDLAKVGIGVGPGVDVSLTLDGKKYGAAASATADALIAAKKGKTWYADDEDGARTIMEGILADQILDQVAPEIPGPEDIPVIKEIPFLGDIPGPPNPVRAALEQLIEGTPDPDEQFVEGGIEGNAQASASEIVIGAGGKVKVGGYLGGKETPDGYVAYYKQAASAEVWGAVMGRDATALAGGEMLFEVTLDRDGKPTSVTLTTGVTLDADAQGEVTTTDDQTYTETKMTVPLTGDPLRDAGILSAVGGNPLAMVTFVQAAKDDGTITRNSYSQDPNEYGLTLMGEPIFGDFGASVSGNFTTRELQDAKYWDGTGFADRPDC